MAEQIFPAGGSAPGRITPAMFPFYTTGEDNLRLTSFNSQSGVQIKLNVRAVNTRGEIVPQSFDHTPNTDRSAKSQDYTLSGSTILNLTVFATAGAPKIGQTYVLVQVIRGVGAAAIVLGTIVAGYVTATMARGFPGSPIEDSLSGPGFVRTIVGTARPAGQDALEIVPAGARWEIITVFFTFTTTINQTAFTIRFTFVSDGVNATYQIPDDITLVPTNTTAFYILSQHSLKTSTTVNPATIERNFALPRSLILISPGSFNTFTPGIDNTMTWGAPRYEVREWLEV